MKKTIYLAPSIKVRSFETESLLQAGGSKGTPVSEEPATGGGYAKGGIFTSDDGGSQWDD